MWVGFCFGREKKKLSKKTFETLVYLYNSIVLSMFKTHICFVWLLCETVECVLIVFIPFCYPDRWFWKKKILASWKKWQQNLIFSRCHQSIASISTQFCFLYYFNCLFHWLLYLWIIDRIALIWMVVFFKKKQKKCFFFVSFFLWFLLFTTLCSSRV